MSLEPLSTNSVLSMKDILCQLCGQVYKEPRMLICLHNFCTDCLMKYLLNTTKEEVLICPQCKIETKLEGPIPDVLPLNTFVKRNINEYGLLHTVPIQTEMDNKNKEFTEMSHHIETEGKDKMETCQLSEISDSHVGDWGVHTTSSQGWTSSSYNSTVDRLHEKYLQLQTKALQITYAVDSVNQSVDDWKENRYRVKEDIQHRSQYLQSLIRQLERKLIAEMESSKHVDEFMEEVTNTKAKLQDSLKLTLHNIQFIRQLINDGQKDDIICLGKAVLQMRPNELCNEIGLRLPEYKLEFIDDKDSHLASEFGELEKIWRKKSIMTSDDGKVDASQQKSILSNKPADLTRSMTADSSEIYRTKNQNKVSMSPSSPSHKRSNRHSMVEGTSKHLMILTDAEKNIYLKYEEARKNLERRRRELAVKHMVGNKSRSQDESTTTQSDDIIDKSLRSSNINKNLSLNKAIENKLEKVEEIHAGSEGDILALNDNWRRSRHDSYREDTGQVHSENSSPIMAAKVTMARKKVTAILSQQQPMTRSNSLSPQTSETSFFGGASNPSTASSDRSPTTPEKVFINARWQETMAQDQKMQEDKEEEEDVLVINAENEHFKPTTRDKLNQVKENIRRKSDRWRSVSATN